MKYISFAIPCYNSEAYMEKAINSILVGGEDVEIIVVNDGSKDGTQEIAERYQEKYPTIVKAVAKPNGGHGDAVNCGLEHATGKYFKVVDSDDWVDEEALLKVLDTIKGFVKDESEVDMVIANYVYEKVGMTHKKVIRYDNVLPENQIFKWEYRNWNSSYSPAIPSPRWSPLPRTDCRICFIRSAPAPSRERSSEKTSKSKPTLSLRCNYQSSKRKRSVWKELSTV